MKEEQLNVSSKHYQSGPYQSKPQKKNNAHPTAVLENSLFSHLERSEPSPSFSENSSTDMSPASSSSSLSTIMAPLKPSIDGNIKKIKDKKKQRPNKESSKDSKKSKLKLFCASFFYELLIVSEQSFFFVCGPLWLLLMAGSETICLIRFFQCHIIVHCFMFFIVDGWF